MRVLTYNIAGARGGDNHLQEVARLIQESDADVVGLQEVIHPHHKGAPHGPNPEEELARLAGMYACFLPAHVGRRNTLGNAVLCREPIVRTLSHELPYTFPERRVLLEVETSLGGLPVTVFCTHLVHLARAAARIRLMQATHVAQQMHLCPHPHLLVGDLNASPHSRELRPIRERTGEGQHLKGLRSWPSRRPLLLYDHIWPGPGWEVLRTETLSPHLSDHRPLLAELRWNGDPPHERISAES